MNDLIPNDVRSPEDLDDVLATIGTLGIDVLERQPKLPSSVLKRKFEEEVEPGEDLGLDLAPGAVEQTDDPPPSKARFVRPRRWRVAASEKTCFWDALDVRD